MAGKKSAGLIMYRYVGTEMEVLLVHPGGPFWARKDEGAWSIPKGEYEEHEPPLHAARREFAEETGFAVEAETFVRLDPIRQPSRKVISAWAFAGDCDPGKLRSATFAMEWPPRSGKQAEFPEVDRAGWFAVEAAKRKIVKGQVGFLDQLCRKLGYEPTTRGGT